MVVLTEHLERELEQACERFGGLLAAVRAGSETRVRKWAAEYMNEFVNRVFDLQEETTAEGMNCYGVFEAFAVELALMAGRSAERNNRRIGGKFGDLRAAILAGDVKRVREWSAANMVELEDRVFDIRERDGRDTDAGDVCEALAVELAKVAKAKKQLA